LICKREHTGNRPIEPAARAQRSPRISLM
jgi:hypothetical protein